MKVLFLANIPSPYRVDFFNELGKYCELTVLYERKSALDRDKNWKYDEAQKYKPVFLKGTNIGVDAAICLSITKWLKKDKFDIIIVGGYSTPTGMLAIQTMKLRNIPFILNIDGGFIKEDSKASYLIKKYFISSAKWWLSTGGESSKYLTYYGANKENIFVYPFTSVKKEEVINKIISVKQKIKYKEKLGIFKKRLVISVGRYINSKGFDKLIEAWKDVDKETQLLIIGSGPEEEYLESLIIKNKLKNVKLIQFKQKEELKEYYLAADLFILPTKSDVWGLVVNEAMAFGLPIITTNKCIAGIELIRNDVNGYIIQCDNSKVMSERINEVLEKDDNLEAMGKNNIQKMQMYTIEKMAQVHYDIFKRILYK